MHGDGGQAPPVCRGAAELRAMISEEVRRRALEAYGSSLAAVVLTGSVARDEGTFEAAGERCISPGDAEFFLVFKERAAPPSPAGAERLAREAQASLGRQGVVCRLDLAPVRPGYFRSLPPAIFTYELRTCGKEIWGEHVLSLIPAFPPEAIPLEDGFRLLCNRMVEFLGALAEGETAAGARYAATKLYLDMATSLLLFAGRYEPTYRGRQSRLSALAERPDVSGEWPFPLEAFSRRIRQCTEWKLAGGAGPGGREFCAEAVRHAHSLWRWELARLTGADAAAGDGEVWARWRKAQPLAGRIRGWLYAARAMGWRRSRRYWPRWARLAWGGSPRFWIYGAASELLFGLPALGEAPAEPARIASRLPCPGDRDESDWPRLCAAVFDNYKRFVAGTRA